MQRYTGAKGGGHTTHANTIREKKFNPFRFDKMFL